MYIMIKMWQVYFIFETILYILTQNWYPDYNHDISTGRKLSINLVYIKLGKIYYKDFNNIVQMITH